MPKKLPDIVTHLDILKTFAVIFMIVDHIGFYFFPDALWWRAVGRIGAAPFWFFLIGYATTRELPTKLLLGALVLVAADLILFNNLLPFNILVGIILVRLTLDYTVNFIFRTRYIFTVSIIMLSFSFFALNIILEYGTFAWLFAFFGYFTRHKDRIINTTFFNPIDYIAYSVFIFLIFCFFENAIFGFNNAQFAFMAIGLALVMIILANIRPMTFPEIRNKNIKTFFKFCGRKTLEIYVGHLLLFKLMSFAIFALK